MVDLGDLQVTFDHHVYWKKKEVNLRNNPLRTRKRQKNNPEMLRLLLALTDQPDETISVTDLYEDAWIHGNPDHDGANSQVYHAMHFIQQCFEETGESFDRLKNVLNEGYYWSTGTANADFQLGHLSLFTGISQANYLDKLVELGPGQFRIVEILAKNHGKPISRENMYLAYRNIATVDNGPKTMDGVINTQIKLIRKAFKKIDDQFDLIRSVTGAGYYWKSPSES